MCTGPEIAARCGRDVHIAWWATHRSLSVMAEGSGVGEALGQAPNEVERLGVAGQTCCGPAVGVEDRGVIAPAEGAADGGERLGGVLAREVHGDLPRPGEAGGAAG